mmetsp:Transcript_18802/g.47707  ORF Transcript_18802/g.47707 Transcript_18802/m.47707 type:complete len:208 (-) Transcript_18802:197-820(-)
MWQQLLQRSRVESITCWRLPCTCWSMLHQQHGSQAVDFTPRGSCHLICGLSAMCCFWPRAPPCQTSLLISSTPAQVSQPATQQLCTGRRQWPKRAVTDQSWALSSWQPAFAWVGKSHAWFCHCWQAPQSRVATVTGVIKAAPAAAPTIATAVTRADAAAAAAGMAETGATSRMLPAVARAAPLPRPQQAPVELMQPQESRTIFASSI